MTDSQPIGYCSPPKETQFKPGSKARKAPNLLGDARIIERILIAAIQDPLNKKVEISRLTLAFVSLVDCIRELRQIPRQGQLRPDLDPAQALKMMNRLRTRMPVEIPGAVAGLSDGPGFGGGVGSGKGFKKGWRKNRKTTDAVEVTSIDTLSNDGTVNGVVTPDNRSEFEKVKDQAAEPEQKPSDGQPQTGAPKPAQNQKPLYGVGTP